MDIIARALANQAKLTDLSQLSQLPISKPQRGLEEIYQNAIGQLFNATKGLDVSNPARTYTLQFTASTATTSLAIPMYSGFSAVANTDNQQFINDKASIAFVAHVYDMTANTGTDLYSSFNRVTKTVTLTAASDGTSRTWQVVVLAIPYQGLMPQLLAHNPTHTFFEIIYDPGLMLLASDGYGTSGTSIPSPLIAKLPLDYTADVDTSFTGTITIASGLLATKTAWVPWVHNGDTANPLGQIYAFSTTAAAYRGGKITSSQFQLYASPINAVPATYLASYFCLAKVVQVSDDSYHDPVFQNGEIVMLVATSVNTTTTPTIFGGTNSGRAADVFRLPGRPVHEGEVWRI